jgi:cysteine desulfurase/selenocysteine lyase
MDRIYRESYANVHRGVYTIAEEATAAYEDGRTKIARLLNAGSPNEIVFTKNVTEAINLVAHSWARTNLREGDAVVITEMEHHANVVPWHMLAAERGVEVRWIPLTDEYQLDTSKLDELLHGAKLLSVTAASNVLGTINDIPSLASAAHAAGALMLVDAAQAVPHFPVDVQAWGADFVGFTGHKMLGPSGIGGLWARPELLEAMPPFLGGGEMIRDVTKEGFTPNEVPWKFEAGTMPIVESVGLGAAVDYLSALGLDAVRAHEKQLTVYALDRLTDRFGSRLRIDGPRDVEVRGGTISMVLEGVHAHDVAQVVDEEGICVRASHHCAKPLMRILDVPATVRASLYVYNDESDVDTLVDGLVKAEQFFAV